MTEMTYILAWMPGPMELMVILVVAILLFGRRLPEIARGMGNSITEFKQGLNEAKTEMLGVDASLVAQQGAVSEVVARAMAHGAVRHSRARVAVAVTGIAGPGGGSPDKPVGLVWFGFMVDGRLASESQRFAGDRAAVRAATVRHALARLLALVEATET